MDLSYLFYIVLIIFYIEDKTLATPIVTAPTNASTFCGLFHYIATRWIVISGDKFHPYYLNVTASQLKKKGYEVKVNSLFRDLIMNMTYTKGSIEKTIAFDSYQAIAPVGGRPALRIRAYYMALIGDRRGNDTKWFCDGVLISNRWVLSAAHCFISPYVQLWTLSY